MAASGKESKRSYENVVMWVCWPYIKPMPRLSIDLTAEQHKAIKARALLSDQTIRDYILNLALQGPPTNSLNPSASTPLPHEQGIDWEADLKARIDEAVNARFADFDVDALMYDAKKRYNEGHT